MGLEVPRPNGARGAHEARWGWVRDPEKKNLFSKRARSEPWVLARGSGFGYGNTRPEPDSLPFLSGQARCQNPKDNG